MRLKFQRPPAREDQDTQITEYEAKAVEILNFLRKKAKKKKAQIPPFECYDFLVLPGSRFGGWALLLMKAIP